MQTYQMSSMTVCVVLLTVGPMLAAYGLTTDKANATSNASSTTIVPDDEMRRATTNPLRGEVVSIEKNMVTVLDITTGREVPFVMGEKLKPNSIHQGDRVRVIFSEGNPGVASSVNKE